MPAIFYRDPLRQMEEAESKKCTGCCWEHRLTGVPRCGKGNKHGKRCKDYREVRGK